MTTQFFLTHFSCNKEYACMYSDDGFWKVLAEISVFNGNGILVYSLWHRVKMLKVLVLWFIIKLYARSNVLNPFLSFHALIFHSKIHKHHRTFFESRESVRGRGCGNVLKLTYFEGCEGWKGRVHVKRTLTSKGAECPKSGWFCDFIIPQIASKWLPKLRKMIKMATNFHLWPQIGTVKIKGKIKPNSNVKYSLT